MQSWGTTSRFDERDTQLEPSKSGVLGLVCCALGRDRALPVDDLAALCMGVRVDREGIPMRDYQTVGGDRDTARKTLFAAQGAAINRTIVSPRYYLSDAVFLVGLEGDVELLGRIDAALDKPHWPLYLGRKSFPPGLPPRLPGGLCVTENLRDTLRRYPRLCAPRRSDANSPLRLLLEDQKEGAMRMDQPLAPFAERCFGPRFVRSEVIEDVPDQTLA